jgi:hypothetical protein
MKPANLCTACGDDFHSESAFDNHRIGGFPQHGPSEYTARLEQGLLDVTEQWRPKPNFGRRCLTPAEMRARGMTQDQRGRWRLPVRGTPPWARDVNAQNGRPPSPRPVPPPPPFWGAASAYHPRATYE